MDKSRSRGEVFVMFSAAERQRGTEIVSELQKRGILLGTAGELAEDFSAFEGAFRATVPAISQTARSQGAPGLVCVVVTGSAKIAARFAESALGFVRSVAAGSELEYRVVLIRPGPPGDASIIETDVYGPAGDGVDSVRHVTMPLELAPSDVARLVAQQADALGTETRAGEQAAGAPARAGFTLWIDPGDAAPEDVADVLRALSDLHKAHGGTGLAFRADGDQIVALAEEAAPA